MQTIMLAIYCIRVFPNNRVLYLKKNGGHKLRGNPQRGLFAHDVHLNYIRNN